MQRELEANFPMLDIDIVGVNDWALAAGNGDITAGRNIPWLQDVDSDRNGVSDIWEQWDVTFRDVVILDTNNETVGVFNLTGHDLSDPKNYSALQQMFIGTVVPEPSAITFAGFGVMAILFIGRRR